MVCARSMAGSLQAGRERDHPLEPVDVDVAEAAAQVVVRVRPPRRAADHEPAQDDVEAGAHVEAVAEPGPVGDGLIVERPADRRSRARVEPQAVAEERADHRTAVEVEDEQVHVDGDGGAAAADDEALGVAAALQLQERFEPEIELVTVELPLAAATEHEHLVEVAAVAVDVRKAAAVALDLVVGADADVTLLQRLTLSPPRAARPALGALRVGCRRRIWR